MDALSLTIENYSRALISRPVRKFRYQFVSYHHPLFTFEGMKPYPGSPGYKRDSFYHVIVYNLGEPWWRVPTVQEQTILKARYGDDLQF